jgi:hypothetical protein
MRINILITALFITLASLPIHAGQLSCASKGSVRAQDSLRIEYSWPVIYRVYRAYERCDENVYFSEAFSTGILKSLVKKWETLPELQKFAASDSTFLDFVLIHIDATADYDAVKQILLNISKNCPAKCGKLCERLRARTQRAASQIEQQRQEEK